MVIKNFSWGLCFVGGRALNFKYAKVWSTYLKKKKYENIDSFTREKVMLILYQLKMV